MRVIDPAVKDINEYTNLSVSWTQRKAGRRVTHLTFTFAEKPPISKRPNPTQPDTAESTKKKPAVALIYPASLTDLEQDKAGELVAHIEPETAQELLDTLEASIRAGQVKKSKLALLGGIIKRFNSGTFDPASAMQIAIERQTQKANALANKKAYLNGEIAALERLYNSSKDSNLFEQLERARKQLEATT